MFLPLNSFEREMVIASSAALVAEYTEPVGSGVRPTSELILIMLPPLSPNSFNDSLLRLLHLLRQTAWRSLRLYSWKRLLQGLLYLLVCSLCQSILVWTTKLGRHSVAALSILTHTGLQFRPYPVLLSLSVAFVLQLICPPH